MRDKYFIQKYSLLAASIGTPIFLLAGNHARPPLLISGGGFFFVIFCWALIATVSSGVAFDSPFKMYTRSARPGRFWALVVAQVFVCCICGFAVVRGIH